MLLIKVTQTREFGETCAVFVLFTGGERVSKCQESALSKIDGWQMRDTKIGF